MLSTALLLRKESKGLIDSLGLSKLSQCALLRVEKQARLTTLHQLERQMWKAMEIQLELRTAAIREVLEQLRGSCHPTNSRRPSFVTMSAGFRISLIIGGTNVVTVNATCSKPPNAHSGR